MAYKDKDKQRAANRLAQARFKAKGITQGITEPGITEPGITDTKRVIPTSNKRGKDIKCFEDLHPEIQATIDRNSRDKDGKLDEAEKSRRTTIAIHYQHLYPDRYEPRSDLKFTRLLAQADRIPNVHLTVSKPGDEDYDGICTPE